MNHRNCLLTYEVSKCIKQKQILNRIRFAKQCRLTSSHPHIPRAFNISFYFPMYTQNCIAQIHLANGDIWVPFSRSSYKVRKFMAVAIADFLSYNQIPSHTIGVPFWRPRWVKDKILIFLILMINEMRFKLPNMAVLIFVPNNSDTSRKIDFHDTMIV